MFWKNGCVLELKVAPDICLIKLGRGVFCEPVCVSSWASVYLAVKSFTKYSEGGGNVAWNNCLVLGPCPRWSARLLFWSPGMDGGTEGDKCVSSGCAGLVKPFETRLEVWQCLTCSVSSEALQNLVSSFLVSSTRCTALPVRLEVQRGVSSTVGKEKMTLLVCLSRVLKQFLRTARNFCLGKLIEKKQWY